MDLGEIIFRVLVILAGLALLMFIAYCTIGAIVFAKVYTKQILELLLIFGGIILYKYLTRDKNQKD